MSSNELATIKQMVYRHCGLLLEGIAEERLRKSVLANMQEQACASFTAYRQLISQNSKAFDQLINQLTVNETYFFREAEQIQLLVEHLLPQILANKGPTAKVRLLSAGCSSGEEPYSLAIALREGLGETAAKRIEIDAGDLDQEILKKARLGLYSDFSFRGVKPAIRKRYFKPQTQGHQLIPEIRQQVNFYELNLLAPVFPKQLVNYDLIFFRNVSIYFDLETRRLIQQKFYELMPDNGILILGSSETLGNNLGVFELVEQQNQYYFVKGKAYLSDKTLIINEPAFAPDPPRAFSYPAQTYTAQARPTYTQANLTNFNLPDIKTIQQLVIDGKYERALQLLDNRLKNSEVEHQSARLLKSWILLNNQEFAAAEQLLACAFKADAWSIDVLLMKGLSAKWQQQISSAIEWLKKVVYTSPECWSAHYYLADIYRHEQQYEAALRAYQTVLRILGANALAKDCTQWIPLPLPAGDAIFLSQRHLQKLTTQLQLEAR
ncbi:MAG: tetratricopeptide repeat protein [Pseudomonadaceae bacterium]|nr:tetratricopeptide repeat protein [Pseudomonadaceae bacterium]